MPIQEINFDGLVGPTHNFAGLAFGNIASSKHSKNISHPKKAALQGLEKMVSLMRLGIPQGVLPPHERPHIPTLRSIGFDAPVAELLPTLLKSNPALLAQVSSASAMWVANAGIMSPSIDTQDGKAHFTPANLSSMLHRSIEHEFTGRVFRHIFSSETYFKHHDALPGTPFFGDEGAANHTRFSSSSGEHGLECFVYGQSFMQQKPKPCKFPARQSLEASQAIARLHQIPSEKSIFLQQNPDVIDQGVFHNDVIAVGSKNILLCHEQAFIDQAASLKKLKALQEQRTGEPFFILEAPTHQVSVADAVNSYLFNTQMIFTDTQKAMIIAPIECKEIKPVKKFLESVVADENPISEIRYFDLRQSMNNGGGPACLRFRATLTDQERQSLTTNTLLTEDLYETLKVWIDTHYRDELTAQDLGDPQLYLSNAQALDELTQILKFGSSLYDFQGV